MTGILKLHCFGFPKPNMTKKPPSWRWQPVIRWLPKSYFLNDFPHFPKTLLFHKYLNASYLRLFFWFAIWDTLSWSTSYFKASLYLLPLINFTANPLKCGLWVAFKYKLHNLCMCVQQLTISPDVNEWFHVKMGSDSKGLDFSDAIHFWTCDTLNTWHIYQHIR